MGECVTARCTVYTALMRTDVSLAVVRRDAPSYSDVLDPTESGACITKRMCNGNGDPLALLFALNSDNNN